MSHGVVEHADAVGRVAVTVEVAAELAAGEVGLRLVEGADLVRASGQRPHRAAVVAGRGEGRAGGVLDHGQPGRVAAGDEVALRDRVGGGEPVDDLLLTGARRLERRVVEIDPAVEDADGHPSPVPGLVRVLERDRPGVLRRHVGVAVRRRGIGAGECRARRRCAGLLGDLQLLVEVDRAHGSQLAGLGDLRGLDLGAEVVELRRLVADVATGCLDLPRDRADLALLGDDHDRDGLGAGASRVGEAIAVTLAELVALSDAHVLERGERLDDLTLRRAVLRALVGCTGRAGSGGGKASRQEASGRQNRQGLAGYTMRGVNGQRSSPIRWVTANSTNDDDWSHAPIGHATNPSGRQSRLLHGKPEESDPLRYRIVTWDAAERRSERADVSHFQWCPVTAGRQLRRR